MKLGGFWGLTAPMLLILAKNNDIDEVKNMITSVNKYINYEVIEDLQTELLYLYNTIERFPRSFSSDLLPEELVSKKQYLSIKSGKLVGLHQDDDGDVLYSNLIQEITAKVVIEILKEIYSGNNHFELNFGNSEIELRNNLFQYVKEFISKKSFRVNRIWSICDDIVDSLRSDVSCFTNQVLLCDAFFINVGFISNINVNGVQVSFSQEEMKIIEYFLDKDTIKIILDNLDTFKYNERIVFNTPFRELVCRKPTSLLFLIINKFELVKTKRVKSFLENLVIELKEDLENFKRYFDEEIICDEDCDKRDFEILDTKMYFDIINQYKPEKMSFFNDLVLKNYINVSDLRVSDLHNLSSIYDSISLLNRENLNALFHVNYNNKQWDLFAQKLVKVGICGVNLFSLELFKESVRTISFISMTKFKKTRENIEQFNRIISDIEALLDTIRPIGGAIN